MDEEYHKRILEDIKAHVAQTMRETVNGKIDNFVKSFYEASANQVRETKKINDKIDSYIVADNAWKAEANPYIKGLANVSGTAKIVVWLAIAVSSISGAVLVVKSLLK